MFDLDRSSFPPTCLPSDLDRGSLVDVTTIGDRWRVYMDEQTGKIHDGAKYYEKLEAIRHAESLLIEDEGDPPPIGDPCADGSY